MNPFTENNLVEQTVIKLIKDVWGDPACHIDAYKDEDDRKLGRENQGEVVLMKYLLPVLKELNPGLSHVALELAAYAIARDRSQLGMVNANHEIYKLLRDGVNVTVTKPNGESETVRVRFFDLENPSNNHFLAVSQFWVVGETYTRRPDVVLFVNGIPLVLMELKASHKNLADAYRDNIRDYKNTIPRSKDELLEDLNSTLHVVKEFLRKEKIELEPLLKAPSEQKILLLEKYANIIIGNQEKKKKFLNLASELQSAYRAVMPDPSAEDYYQEVTAIRVIASRIRDVGERSVDVSQVKKDLEDLLDKSIQTNEYVISEHKKIKDLSALDADALRIFFDGLENKNMQVASMTAELEAKIEELARRNKKRAMFMERLQSLLQEYNSGAHDIDQLFNDLVDLAKDLSVEEQRAAKEGMNEEALAIFDLLLKDNLNPDEVNTIKSTSHELLLKLKPLLVPHWRDFEPNRAGVRTAISDLLYDKLPAPIYTDQDCEVKGCEVYNFVYEHYRDSGSLIAA